MADGKILVVDDNPINRRIARSFLERVGYDVATAEDGQDAIDHLLANPCDAVLMDCQMPRMDGFEATRHIRGLELERGAERTPILALTAGAFQGGAKRCREAGMDGYLSKPVGAASLVGNVARAAKTRS